MTIHQPGINYKLTIFLLIWCVVLAVILIAEWGYSRYSRNKLYSSLENSVVKVDEFERLPELKDTNNSLESYAEMVNRPLFVEGRRPVEDAESVEQLDVFSGKMELILTGIIETPEGVTALVQDKQKNHFRLILHDPIQGWEVEAIEADKIIMKRNKERSELMLRKPRPPGMPEPPAAKKLKPKKKRAPKRSKKK